MPVQMRAAGDGYVLSLMGDFGWDVTAKGVQAALKEAGGKALTVTVNSYGGDAFAGVAVHNMLARYPGKKTVVVEGVAASAASLAVMAGDRIVMPDNAMLMIHEAWGGATGDADDLRQHAELLDSLSASYRRAYAARSGKPEEEVAALMAAETWFDAEAAVAAGFADEVAAPSEVRAQAAPAGRFERVPAALAASQHKEAVRMPDVDTPAGGQPASQPQAAATAPAPQPAPAPPPVPAATPQPAYAAASADAILDIAARNGLDIPWAQGLIRAGATREAALEAALEAFAARGNAKPVQSAVVVRDEKDTFLARASSALFARFTNREPTEDAREYVSMGLHGMVREMAFRAGRRDAHRMGPDEVANFVLASHSSSDFAAVLANSTNKSVRTMYGAYPNTWSIWTNEIEVDDFKTITAAHIGPFPELEELPEGGPVTMGSIAEEAETYAVRERGRLIALTRTAIVNDDTMAFEAVIRNAALAAYSTLRRVAFGVLTTNAAMADTVALFNAAHGNLGTAGNLSATTYAELRALLNKAASPVRAGSGEAAQSLPPPTQVALLVGPDEEDTALELLGNRIVPTAVGATLPDSYRSSTTLVMEPYLDTGNDPYYLVRRDMPGVDIAYLRGRRAPTVTSAEQITHTGVTFRVMFDFGAKATTWRTMAANLG